MLCIFASLFLTFNFFFSGVLLFFANGKSFFSHQFHWFSPLPPTPSPPPPPAPILRNLPLFPFLVYLSNIYFHFIEEFLVLYCFLNRLPILAVDFIFCCYESQLFHYYQIPHISSYITLSLSLWSTLSQFPELHMLDFLNCIIFTLLLFFYHQFLGELISIHL